MCVCKNTHIIFPFSVHWKGLEVLNPSCNLYNSVQVLFSIYINWIYIWNYICKWKWHSHVLFFVTHGLYSPWNSLGQNTGVGRLSLLPGFFPSQGSKPGLLCCTQILYQLSHQGSPRILEWVAYPFSSKSSQPRNRTTLQANSLPTELSGKPSHM